jgi:hypothetical protein
MRKILRVFIIPVTLFFLAFPNSSRAEVPAKAKAMLTILGYGTAGGAILGAASMAFGTSSRAIAQGASLGLYAGILFGTYVLVSHHNRRQGAYDDGASPYQESSDIYGDDYQDGEGGGGQDGGDRSGFFNRFQALQDKFGDKKRGGQLPPLQVNLFSLQF